MLRKLTGTTVTSAFTSYLCFSTRDKWLGWKKYITDIYIFSVNLPTSRSVSVLLFLKTILLCPRRYNSPALIKSGAETGFKMLLDPLLRGATYTPTACYHRPASSPTPWKQPWITLGSHLSLCTPSPPKQWSAASFAGSIKVRLSSETRVCSHKGEKDWGGKSKVRGGFAAVLRPVADASGLLKAVN